MTDTSDGETGTVIVLITSGGSYASMSSVHFSASRWEVSRGTGRLTVWDGEILAGEFPEGRWIAVVDDKCRQPDMNASALTAAQNALERIADGVARGSLTMGQIARLAADGLMEVRAA